MHVSLDSFILFVQDVDLLKHFYVDAFSMEVVEEYPSEWVLLTCGQGKLGLHRVGPEYRDADHAGSGSVNNCKIVFVTGEDIHAFREALLLKHTVMREVKSFDNYPFWICDGEDPEGNVFQVKQHKYNSPER